MPGFDATGPQGQGAETGWGQGRCGGDAQGVSQAAMGRGGLQGSGGGRRRCRWQGRRDGFQGRRGFTAPSTGVAQSFDSVVEASDDALEALKREAQICSHTLEGINARIRALEAAAKGAQSSSTATA